MVQLSDIDVNKIRELCKQYDTEVGDDWVFEIGEKVRARGYLIKDEFLSIVRWKSPRPIGFAMKNSEEKIKQVTGAAFKLNSEELKIEKLLELEGVGVPMASSILTIIYPEKYAVIDIRAWATLVELGIFNSKKNYFNTQDWLDYLGVMRKKAEECGVTPRMVDKAFYMMDKISSLKLNTRTPIASSYLIYFSFNSFTLKIFQAALSIPFSTLPAIDRQLSASSVSKHSDGMTSLPLIRIG